MTRQESTVLLREARAGFPRSARRALRALRRPAARVHPAAAGPRPALASRVARHPAGHALKSFQRLEQFEGGDGASLMGWLARIAENEIRDRADYQHRQRRDVARRRPASTPAAPLSRHACGRRSPRPSSTKRPSASSAALERSTPDHREVIVLRKFEELSFREIGVAHGRAARTRAACCSRGRWSP